MQVAETKAQFGFENTDRWHGALRCTYEGPFRDPGGGALWG